jgi:hypothetical protein
MSEKLVSKFCFLKFKLVPLQQGAVAEFQDEAPGLSAGVGCRPVVGCRRGGGVVNTDFVREMERKK